LTLIDIDIDIEVFPLHQIAHIGVCPSINLNLISREIIFEVFQPMFMLCDDGT